MPRDWSTASGNRVDSAGKLAVHTHTCQPDPGSEKGLHTWQCNSPYCEALPRICPDHGGREPIVIGEEPWRGR